MATLVGVDLEANNALLALEQELHAFSQQRMSFPPLSRAIEDVMRRLELLANESTAKNVSAEIVQRITWRLSTTQGAYAQLKEKHDQRVRDQIKEYYGEALRDPIKTNLGNVTFRPYLKAVDHKTQEHPIVALKESKTNDVTSQENPIRESSMLQLISADRHHGMLRWVRAHRTSTHFFCATEFIKTGDLFTFLTTRAKTEPNPNLMGKFRELCYAIDYLHNGLFIAHLDLKPENVLVTPEGGIRICDLGVAAPVEPIPAADSAENAELPMYGDRALRFELATRILSLPDDEVAAQLEQYPVLPVNSTVVDSLAQTRAANGEEPLNAALLRVGDVYSPKEISDALVDSSGVRVWAMQGVVGTVSYMSPEVMRGAPFNPFCADIYSLGVILFIMTTSFPPYKARADRAYAELRAGGVGHLLKLYGVLDKVDARVVTLLDGMMSFDEGARPSIKQVLAQLSTICDS